MSQLEIREQKSVTRVTEGFYIVKSQTTDGKFYRVNRSRNANTWTCSCPDFQSRVRRFVDDTRCKHVLLAEIYHDSKNWFSADENDSDLTTEQLLFAPRPKICDECGSTDIKKSGFRKLIDETKRQRYTCLECGHRFILGEKGFRKLKADPEIIIEAINLVFNGMSLRPIARHLKITKQMRITHQTVDNWFKRYMKLINEFVDSVLPVYSSQYWCVDEMVLNVKNTKKMGYGYYLWLWSTIDPKTRFLIASEISKHRYLHNAQHIISISKKNVANNPSYVVTDSLKAYQKALLSEFEDRIIHVKTKSFAKGFENRPIERFHNEIREIIKTKRGLGNDKSAQEFADNYRTFHNFARPHSGLPNNITPAEACGIDLNLGENKVAGLLKKAMQYKYNFETQLKKRIRFVNIHYEEDCTRVAPKGIIDKQVWREINDILRLNGFSWISNGRESCWMR